MTNRLELNWKLDGFVGEQRYYCSEIIFTNETKPTPKAVLGGDVRAYVDTAVEAGKEYYVAISSVKSGVEKISEIVSVSTWSPNLIAKAWYDFSDESTVTLSDNAVSQIIDKSVNNYHLSQSITTRMPLYVTLESGKKSAKFDGIDDFLCANAALLNTEHSLFIVFKPTIKSSVGSLFGQWQSGSVGRYVINTNQNSYGVTTPGKLNPFNSTASNGSGLSGFINDLAISDVTTIFGLISNTGSENCKVYKNGVMTDSATITGVFTGVNTAIGSVSASQLLNPYDGYVCEVVVVDYAISIETQRKLENYLSKKWGVAI